MIADAFESARADRLLTLMKFKPRLFLILWIAGLAGVLSMLLIDLPALMANLPVTEKTPLPLPPLLLMLLGTIQPTVLISLAILVGIALASKVGLAAPAAEAAARRESFMPALKPQIIPGLIGGFAGGVAVLSTWLLWRLFLPPLFIIRAERLNQALPFVTRLLYGGVVEELLLRWGVMTFLVWLSWRLFQKSEEAPRAIWFVTAIIVSSVVFGIGHLPLVVALGFTFTPAIVSYVVVANALFGLIAGSLYWKRGLEAAIIAHMVTHVILKTAIYFGT